MDTLQQCVATILFCALASPFLFYYLLSWWKNANDVAKSRGRPVPEADGAWPIIGHLLMLRPPTAPHRLYSSLAEKYGPIFTLRIGLRKTLVINSWEVAKECFTTHDKVFASSAKTIGAKILGFDNSMFKPHPYGPYWREMRKVVKTELLSNRRLEQLKHIRVMEITTSIKELYQFWEAENKNVKERVVVMVDIDNWFADLMLNIAIKMVTGKRYFGATSKEDKEEARQIHKAIQDFGNLFGVFVVSDAIPFLGWLDYQGHVKAMKRSAKEVGCILDRWLEEHKQKKTSTAEDFMDVLLSVLQDKQLFGRDADTVNKAFCMNMILGASDGNKVTLTWALSYLLNNRHILNKAQEEIDIHVGKDKQVEESDVEKLVYLQAIVKETLRLYPIFSAPRESSEDCNISGFHVPKGTQLITNFWQIHRDPRVWSNPCEFQPERFLTTQANLDFRGQHEYIPFGSGCRMCPGISLAGRMMHLTLARLLQGFDFAKPMDAPLEMDDTVGVTFLQATPLEVLITPRLPLHLY
ncbi:Cytochrome p450 [Thalictrum thalictroides]|uniref:Cytochrome p450 n=1 Tax=Thalictrum thalictroides TaxID=46969 RepID=A0A7J6W3V4_THATH|nr:Cytochrome p450 [Thalictrum thalictroides]